MSFSNKILKSKLNLKSIEQAILTNNFIEYADVSIFVDGKVEVNIKEKICYLNNIFLHGK